MTKNNFLDQEEVAKFNKIADNWWNINGPLKTLHHINPCRVDFINNQVNLNGKTVLDLGCGGGILAESMAKLGANVTGLDVDEKIIQVAIDHARVSKLNINYVCSPVESWDREKFDVITCLEMLEHVPNTGSIISHCQKLLKPGGTLILSTINRSLIAYLKLIVGAEYVLGILPRQTHDYKKFIKPSELSDLLQQYNFSIISTMGMDYFPWSQKAVMTTSTKANYFMVAKI